jgi:hypothetical protein
MADMFVRPWVKAGIVKSYMEIDIDISFVSEIGRGGATLAKVAPVE